MKSYSQKNKSSGFSIIELLVASALFLTVVAVATAAFVSILDASAQNREFGVLMSNLDFAMEDISRNVRTGDRYTTGSNNSLTLETYVGNGTEKCRIYYRLWGGSIQKAKATLGDHDLCNTYNYSSITSSEIDIQTLSFLIDDTAVQPRVIINVVGEIDSGVGQSFILQTSVTQRILDFSN